MNTAIVLFTRDHRLTDNPALALACAAARHVVPVFVHDPKITPGPVRAAFLENCLADLRGGLRERGGALVERHGDPVAEVIAVAREVGAEGIVCASDVSGYAQARQRRLAAACTQARLHLRLADSLTVVPPGSLTPAGGDHYRIFTPYWRRWQAVAVAGKAIPAPDRISLPDGLVVAEGPVGREGEHAAHARLATWRREWADYDTGRDDLAGDRTSRLSAYLHFGCLSPRALLDGPEAYVRQVCWRDFYHQLCHAFPQITNKPYRQVDENWTDDPDAYAAWCAGQTGVPLVDAGMRQLAAEGFMHNRARMVVASFLTKYLGIDWRLGAAHFMDSLADADVANNYGNWQWVAGTGNDTRPNRRLSPIRQGHRHDPQGDYVRRYVPELAGIDGSAVHEPWKLPQSARGPYPAPVIDM